MKYNGIRLVIFLCGISSLFARAGNEELFLRANNLYTENNFTLALATYEKINNKGPAVWYNMGNCAYQTQDMPYALVCWQRAKRVASRQLYSNSEYNIARVKNEHEVQEADLFVRVVEYISHITFFFLQLFFLVLLATTLILTGQRQYKKYYWMMILCALLTSMSGCLIGIKYVFCSQCSGIVMMNEASLYTGPDNQYHIVGSVAQAEQVRIYQDKDGWYKIGYNNNVGWVAHNAIALV